jgi:N-acetylglucosamine-6-phosphate deacetylase
MPDGEYVFGPADAGEPVLKRDGVGLMPDGQALASGVMGLDHCLRVMRRATSAGLPEAVRMASLTPARIAGVADTVGSIEVGKWADLLVADAELGLRRVFVGGEVVAGLS